MLGRPRRRVLARQGRYVLRLDDARARADPAAARRAAELLALSPKDPRVRRLYPAAYAEDPELEDEYQRLTQEELRSGRLASVDAVEASVDAEVLDADQLTAWMQAVNALRLILGTMLDITDDDQELDFDPSHPEARTMALYGYLGGLLDEIVDVQLDG